jgi:hypothetical protein
MPPAMTTIISLLFSGSPFAIFGRVRAIIVDAFECCSGKRRWTHVRTEVFKAMTPSSANNNTPAPVVFPSGVVRIVASSLQQCPDMVKRSGRSTMCSRSLYEKFEIKTAARARRLSCEGVSSDNAFCPAVAATKPRCFTTFCPSRGKHRPSSKSSSVNWLNRPRHARQTNHKCGGFMTTAMGVPLIG